MFLTRNFKTSLFPLLLATSCSINAQAGVLSGNIWGYQVAGLVSYLTNDAANFYNVHAQFKVPSATCTHTNDDVAMWVGLTTSYIGPGDNGQQLIPGDNIQQIGIDINCSTGNPVFSGFYQSLYNDDGTGPHTFTASNSYVVHPGDTISLSVVNSRSQPGHYTFSCVNSGKWTYTAPVQIGVVSSPMASVVVESRIDQSGHFPNFGTINFTDVGGSSTPNGISDQDFVGIATAPPTYSVYAEVSNQVQAQVTGQVTVPAGFGPGYSSNFSVSYVTE